MSTDITIESVRFSYCNLFQPQSKNGQEPKYSVTILVPKTNAAAKAAMDTAVQDAINAGVTKCWNGQRPPMPAVCIHDGDGTRPSDGAEFGSECKGHWVFTASSKQAPFVVDAQVQPIINPTEVYSGMWGNVNVSFFPYNFSGKKGIGCALNGVQKTGDGEPLSGRVTAQEAFKPVNSARAPSAAAYSYGNIDPLTGASAPPAAAPVPPAAYGYGGVDPITGAIDPYAPQNLPY